MVRSSATNLAGHSPEVGICLEIPTSFKAAMRALQSVSCKIEVKRPGARRNVLFNEDTLNLALDFYLREGKPWKRIGSR